MTTRLVLAASLFALSACSFSLSDEALPETGGPTPQKSATFGEPVDTATTVNGFAWDMEAFFLSLVGCGPECPVPPLQLPGIPHHEASLVPNTQVTLFDTSTGAPGPAAVAPTDGSGSWSVEKVEAKPAPFLPFSVNVAATSYAPTLTARPVFGGPRECLGIAALQVSKEGALDAVARFLSFQQAATITVADLLDPTKYGGVALWWLYHAGPSQLRAPGAGTRMTSSAGTTFNISWAPPGALPSPVDVLQSPRGFFVTQPDDTPLGLTVTVFPPLAGPPQPVAFTPVDDVTDEAQGRPWVYPPLPPMVVAPGMVLAGELQGAVPTPPTGALPPEWLCLMPVPVEATE